ncbi:MAG TPA: hypothetical protein VK821_10400 [Dehalococcoidia bacterium]|nr:hypothetical protein [Dehalococcoidia bacterium]
MIGRIVIGQHTVCIDLKREALVAHLFGQLIPAAHDDDAPLISVEKPITSLRRGSETRLVVDGSDNLAEAGHFDPSLVKAIARGHVWFDELVGGRAESIAQIAKRECVTDRYVSQMIEFAFVTPAVIEAVLDGRQVPDLTLRELMQK